MFIKYRLAKKIGWSYILNVDEFEVQYLELKEDELGRWLGVRIVECDMIEFSDIGPKFIDMANDLAGRTLPFTYLAVRKGGEENYTHALIDTEAFLCEDNGETSQRLL